MNNDSGKSHAGRKVLVLDAEPTVQAVVKRILESAGYSAFATADIATAVEICKAGIPDLVITNVSLPGISGHEMMKILKEICPETPVLMVSGLPDSEIIQHWTKQDGFDVFPKPFQKDELLLKIEQVMTERRLAMADLSRDRQGQPS